MKKLFILIAAGIIACHMNASAQDDYQKNFYLKKAASYDKMKNAGIGLTIGGVVLTAVGIAVLADAVTMPYDTQSEIDAADAKIAVGAYATSFGIFATGGGITLWAIGASKKRSYLRKANSLSLNLNPNLNQKLSLAYRF
jgi:hypothetical protein